ncbi:MAG: GNAT family protein [Candidatus Eisenbacteria bacterium]
METQWRPLHLDTETESLAEFLSGETWPFHGTPNPSMEKTTEWVASGRFGNDEDTQSFWGCIGEERVALLTVMDLADPTPVFDLRIATARRQQGIGKSALRFLAEWTFHDADKHRIEGHTRADNLAMRALFRAAGWVQEAHHRQAWGSADGSWQDAVTYTLLRDDFENGTRTPRPPMDD